MGIYRNGQKVGKNCPANTPFAIEETERDGSIIYEIYSHRLPGSDMELLEKFKDQRKCYEHFETLWNLLADGHGPS